MKKSYDSKCYDLAVHFAQDEDLSEHELDELASDIQDTVETFFEVRQNKAERDYENSLSECPRGGEYAAELAESQARVQRELK